MPDDVKVVFGASVEGLLAGVEEAKTAIEGLRAPLGEFAEAASGLGEALGLTYAIEKLKEFAEAFSEAGAHALDMANLYGMTIESFGQLTGALAILTGSTDGAERQLDRLALTVQRVEEGNKAAIASIHNLHISTEEFAQSSKDLTGLLTLIVTRYRELAPELRNLGLLHEILGRNVQNLGALLRASDAEWKSVLAAAKEYSAALKENAAGEDQTALAAHKLNLDLKTLGHEAFGFLKGAIDVVIKLFDELVNAIGAAIKKVEEFWATTKKLRDDLAEWYYETLHPIDPHEGARHLLPPPLPRPEPPPGTRPAGTERAGGAGAGRRGTDTRMQEYEEELRLQEMAQRQSEE